MTTTCLCLVFLILVVNGGATKFDFRQTDYNMKFERLELVRFDTKSMAKFELRTFKYNRTCPLVNMTTTYNVELGNALQVVVQAYKFASNEYRLFPIRVEVNFCDAVQENLLGFGAFIKCGTFRGCPMHKGIAYFYCNWAPDQHHFPSYIPNGRYMLELEGQHHSKKLWVLRGYGEISRPL